MARSDRPTVLVTGATGLVGRSVVRALRAAEYPVTVFVRRIPDAALFGGDTDVSVSQGDLRDPDSLERAFQGINVVVHAAADTDGTLEGGREVTIAGTHHVLDAAETAGVSRVVYISSCSVYSYAGDRAVIDEDAPLESEPERRGPYSWAKTVADADVGIRMASTSFEVVRLRPGLVWGPDGDPEPAVLGRSLESLFVVIGRPQLSLPLVHVDDLADAVRLAVDEPSFAGQTLNVVHPEIVTKKDWISRILRPSDPNIRTVTLPFPIVRILVSALEGIFGLMRRTPPLTRYRLDASQRPVRISSDRLRALGWAPRRPLLGSAGGAMSPTDTAPAMERP